MDLLSSVVDGETQMWRSDDGGYTFSPVPHALPYYFWNMSVSSTGVLFGAGQGLQRSIDGGDTFVNTGLPAGWVWDVAVSPADPWFSGRTAQAWCTAPPTAPTLGHPRRLPPPRSSAASMPPPTDPSICYGTVPTFIDGGESLWVTTDGGDHWESLSTGIRNGWEVHTLAAYPGIVLVGQTIEPGIWFVTSNGRDARHSTRGPDSVINGFTSSGERVLAATAGSGVFVMR